MYKLQVTVNGRTDYYENRSIDILKGIIIGYIHVRIDIATTMIAYIFNPEGIQILSSEFNNSGVIK